MKSEVEGVINMQFIFSQKNELSISSETVPHLEAFFEPWFSHIRRGSLGSGVHYAAAWPAEEEDIRRGTQRCKEESYARVGVNSGCPALLFHEKKLDLVCWENCGTDSNDFLLFKRSSTLFFWKSTRVSFETLSKSASLFQLSVFLWNGSLKRSIVLPGRSAEVLQANSWSTIGLASGESNLQNVPTLWLWFIP